MTLSKSTPSPDELAIRAARAPIRRFNKKALIVVIGGASALVLGSFALAMKSPNEDGTARGSELYSTSNQAKAEGLTALPATYAEVKREVPTLGPPLPGDLGAPILKAQREGRYTLHTPPVEIGDLPSDEDMRAAELQAEQASAARQSALFFSNSGGVRLVSNNVQGTPPRDPFEVLDRLNVASPASSLDQDPNLQRRKEAFVNDVADRAIYNPHRIETPMSPWQVMAGTIIPATLLTGINSDLPGQIIGQVTEPVYDTVTGRTVLIPQGSRIIGRYDNVVAYGQSRALIVWSRIIMPDGTSIRIENLPGTDARGYAGLRDQVDRHAFRIFSTAALSSLITIGAELSDDDDDDITRALRNATQDGASRVGEEIVRRQLGVQPTIKIRPGWRLRIIVHQDIILQPYGGSPQ